MFAKFLAITLLIPIALFSTPAFADMGQVLVVLADPNFNGEGGAENARWVAYSESGAPLPLSPEVFPLVTEKPEGDHKVCTYRVSEKKTYREGIPAARRCHKIKKDAGALLQGAIEYAYRRGLPLKVIGRSYAILPRPGLTAFLSTFRTIHIPPFTTSSIEFVNVVLLSRPLDGGPGIQFDSEEGLYFEQKGGQILYRGKTAAVEFKPTHPTINADRAIQINTSKIKFSGITVQEQAGVDSAVAVEFDFTFGSIWGNYFEFGETDLFNQGDYVVKVSADNEKSRDPFYKTTTFESNLIRASLLVRANKAGVLVGTKALGEEGRIGNNQWVIGSIQPGHEGSIGLISYAKGDAYSIGLVGSTKMRSGLAQATEIHDPTHATKVWVGRVVVH